MSKKDSSPLFDFVTRPGQKRGIQAPKWMNQQPDPSVTYYPPGAQPQQQQQAPPPTHQEQPPQPAPAPTPAPQQAPAPQPAPVQRHEQTVSAADIPQPASVDQPPRQQAESGDGWWAWMSSPLVMRLPRGTVMLYGAVGVGMLIGAFMLGQMQQRRSDAALMTDYEVQAHSLSRVAAEPVNPKLIPPSVDTVPMQTPGSYTHGSQSTPPRRPAGASGAHGDGSATGPTGTPAIATDFDPRQAGLNYFRLQVMPDAGREEGLAAVAFLRENGVDATLIPINNDRSLKLIVLQGFARPNSDPAAQQYKSRLKTLGRLWESKHDGSTDWGDMFPEKYIPGRT